MATSKNKANTPQTKPNTNPQNTVDDSKFAISSHNYKLLAIGFAIIVLGFVLMVGGGSDDPNTFNYDGLFGFQRRTLAPVIVLAGFAFEIYAIMKRPKE